MKFNSSLQGLGASVLCFILGVSLGLSVLSLVLGEVFIEWEVVSLGSVSLVMVLVFDFMSLLFIMTVSLVASGVMVFSGSYMKTEKFYSRFLLLVVSFILSMFFLILSPNLVSLLLGWDGLGVTSYLLVIYYQSSKSYNAGMITALTNRIGDVGILLSISLLLPLGSWSITHSSYGNSSVLTLAIMVLVGASLTKSAQVPFSAWLPAAMAAPTPVSALVHSSTLVTAGVYLLIRHSFILSKVSFLKFLLLVGAITMLMAGAGAMQELDMKKVVALSTLSQLGLMMMTLGMGLPLLSFFHLLAHAYFKAMLFMCAGALIHSMKDYQDIRTMGSGVMFLPFTMSIFSVANLSLCGMPFMAGFYSKDLILEMMMMSSFNVFMFFVASVATFLTVAYTCRLSFLTSVAFVKSESMYTMLDYDLNMLKGMSVLLLPTLGGGLALSWSMFSFSSAIILPYTLKLLVLLLIFSAVMVNQAAFLKDKSLSKSSSVVWMISNMLFLPLTFSALTSKKGLESAKMFTKNNDSAWNELILYKGSMEVLQSLSNLHEKTFMSLFSKSLLASGLMFALFI